MRYDTTIKELLQAGTPQLWRQLSLGEPEEFLNIELASVRLRKPDLLARLTNGALLHLELQADNDDEMDWRELEYYTLLYRQLGEPPVQYVLYFGAEPLRMRDSIVTESLKFHYRLVDMRALSSGWLLASNAMADNLLALLCGGETTQQIISEIVQKLRQLPGNARADWLERLLILAGLRQAEPIVKEEVEKIMDIRDNLFWKEAFGEGESALLRRMLETRFGPLPTWVSDRLKQGDPKVLEEAGIRLLSATKLEEVFPSAPSA